MALQSQPTTPPQPNQAYYSISALNVFHEYTNAASYSAAFGVPPAPFDQTRRPKTWFDSTVDAAHDPEGIAIYYAYRLDPVKQQWGYTLIAMPNKEAATVNILPDAELNFTPLPEWEVPARTLLPNEQLYPFLGNVLQVKRTDLAEQVAEDLGQFTNQDRTLLRAIAKQLNVSA
jgi:hypothetical protein